MADMTKANLATSHIGIDTMSRLRAWAAETIAGIGGCSVYLAGSAIRSKQWRDLDVYVVFTEERWAALSPTGLFTDDGWWLTNASFSARATSIVGAPVEVHFMPPTGFNEADYQRLDLTTMR